VRMNGITRKAVKQEDENGQEMMKEISLPSRRQFIELASAAALSSIVPGAYAANLAGSASAVTFNPRLLPPADDVWASLEAMNQGGVPRFTGNAAHRKFVDMLESDMKGTGLQCTRDSYTFPRWEARKWSLAATPKNGSRIELPVTYYYPHSGQTGPQGVTGAMAYVGKIVSDGSSKAVLSGDLKGKILLVEYEIAARDYNEWYRPWGYYSPAVKPELDKYVSSTMAEGNGWRLGEYKNAGAVGVIFVWSNLSDGQAMGQNWPFGQPIQGLPALLVGRDTGTKLRRLASEGATATLTLEADVFQNAGTDSLVATLPGASSDEVLIVNTHTDGPNAIQENGGVMLVALAKYFSKVPQSSRRRTLVFSLASGHDNGAYVPGKQGGFIERHPDLVKKAMASVAVEHFGCREWRDDASHTHYTATGNDELTYAMTHHQLLAKLELETAPGTAERRVAAVEPTPQGRYLGVGGSLAGLGMPTLGLYGSPTYLNMVAADGCMSKLTKAHMYGQITATAKLLHKLDATPASDLKWLPPTPRRAVTSG
jgi:hypothetical protein